MDVRLSQLFNAGKTLVLDAGEAARTRVHGLYHRLRGVGAGGAGLLQRDRRASGEKTSAAAAARIPGGRRVYAVGDIHGRADLLARLLGLLNEDAAQGEFAGRPILICLGDYVDRGFQSREVIETLLGPMVSPFETYFLKGNHEAAMLQFLSDPAIGPRWAEFGGAETLVSYGVRPPRTRTNIDEWRQASLDLRAQLPDTHRAFLMNLDLSVRIGDYVFVHAGVRPGVGLDAQREQDLLWIRDEFLTDRSHFGAVIVHGHTPAAQPYRDARRVGVDTGAYLSGRLTAVRLQEDEAEFISTTPNAPS